MKKFIILITTAFLISGCTNFGTVKSEIDTAVKNIFTTDNLDTLEASYGAVLAQAIAYRDLCQKKLINKSCWIIIKNAQPYEDKAYKSLLVVRSFVKNNPNADATSLISLAKNSIAAFKTNIPANP